MFSILIQAGHGLNVEDKDGWTPLQAAAHWGERQACEVLVENMADMDLKNKAVNIEIVFFIQEKAIRFCSCFLNQMAF